MAKYPASDSRKTPPRVPENAGQIKTRDIGSGQFTSPAELPAKVEPSKTKPMPPSKAKANQRASENKLERGRKRGEERSVVS